MSRFADLRELFARANEVKSGDQLAGIAARSEQERVAAKYALADTQLTEILAKPLLEDEVTRLIYDSFDETAFVPIRSMTVGALREHILSDLISGDNLKSLQPGLMPEMAAAVAKIMSNKDLVLAAAKIRNVTRCRNTLGQPGGWR